MSKYILYFDDYKSIWRRTKCSVEADSLEDAIDKIKNDEYEVEDSEFLYETEEFVDPEEAGFATLEIVDPTTDDVLWNNYGGTDN